MPASADGLRVRFAEKVAASMTGGTDRTVTAMQDGAPRATGAMANGITVAESEDGPARYRRVIRAPAEYASYQDQGTGVHGPSGARIYPVRGRFLVFEVGGQTVFARSVAGVPATRFFSDPEAAWLGEITAAWEAA